MTGVHAQQVEHKPHRAKPSTPSKRRIVLAHDWTVGVRGGEHVLERIANVIARDNDLADLLTMFDSGVSIGPHIDRLTRHVSNIGELPDSITLRRWLLPAYPIAIESLSGTLARLHEESPVDLLVSTSSCAAKNIRPPEGVPHLCYCHSPARYLWSQRDESARGIAQLGLRAAGPPLRHWDNARSRNVTQFIANSAHIQREIERCYGRESIVVHPHVRTDFFTPSDPASAPADTAALCEELHLDPSFVDQPFLLFVAALEPYKRVDLAIEAASIAGLPLCVVGAGSISRRLTPRNPNTGHVRFVGRISDIALRACYRKAHALLFPQIEDFGIIAAEAQACGCPVIARRIGGAIDIIQDQSTGVFFDIPDARLIAECVQHVERIESSACVANARRFSEARFDAELRAVLDLI